MSVFKFHPNLWATVSSEWVELTWGNIRVGFRFIPPAVETWLSYMEDGCLKSCDLERPHTVFCPTVCIMIGQCLLKWNDLHEKCTVVWPFMSKQTHTCPYAMDLYNFKKCAECVLASSVTCACRNYELLWVSVVHRALQELLIKVVQ